MIEACARAEEQIFCAVRTKLGFDRFQSYLIGAAPAPLEVFEFFAALDIPICRGVGMSELSSIATLVPQDELRFGTVGKAIPGVDIGLADDGELLVRGAGRGAAGQRELARGLADQALQAPGSGLGLGGQ
ncbi:MAG: AMP-binding protein [Solirubrobacteraceae bacterium]